MVWSYQFGVTRPRLVCPRVKVGAHAVQLKIQVHLSSKVSPELLATVIVVEAPVAEVPLMTFVPLLPQYVPICGQAAKASSVLWF
jgi:hypothetical protein